MHRKFLWLLGILGILLTIVYVGYVLLWRDTRVRNPGQQIQPITLTATPVDQGTPFAGYDFLDPDEALALRTHPNVVLVAVLGGGYSARYLRNTAVTLDDSWTEAEQTLDFQGFNPPVGNGTSFVVQLRRESFVLNVRQGFVPLRADGKNPQHIYLVDEAGVLWQKALTQVEFVTSDIAVKSLPQGLMIAPNLELSLTIR